MGGRYEKYVLMPSRLASLVANAVSYFCSTSSQYPAPRHIQAPSWLHQDDIESLQQHLYPAVERRWLESIDQNHQAGVTIFTSNFGHYQNPIFQQIMFCLMKHKMLTHSCWVFYYVKKAHK
jgi:hypothetical protein